MSYLRKYRISAFAAIVMMIIELLVELLQPFIISKMIDDGIRKGELSVVLMWGGVLAGFALIALCSGIVSSFFASHVSQSFAYDLREKLFKTIQTFSLSVFDRFATSSLLTRLTNDITQLQNTVFMGLRIMMRAPLLVVGSVVMAFVVYPRLALLLTVIVPILLIFLVWMLKRAGRLFRIVQINLDHVNRLIQENLMGMRLIRVFGRMSYESERFANTSKELMFRTISVMRLTELTMPFILLMMNSVILAILWFGQIEVYTGAASMGEVVAIINYSMRTTGALSVFSMIVVNFSRAKASAERIAEVLETKDEFVEEHYENYTSRRIQGHVQFDAVSFRYPDKNTHALYNISFQAKAGSTVAIMGMTGSGKSSLLSLILRLYEPNEGAILLDNKDIRNYELDYLRLVIGYVPQETSLFTGTIHENIAWGKPDATLDEVIKAAQLAQIHDTIIHFPSAYETLLGQKGVNLSGGQKQRLAIARSLVRNPQLLLLDDCTSALDVKTESALLHALKDMSCTTFLITQKISSALQADLIMVVDNGRLIAQGTHTELLASGGLYQTIYESQLEGGALRHVEGVK
ncbi:ABC transporter ATP-binding protein [Paenibacillus sp. CMAA1364]